MDSNRPELAVSTVAGGGPVGMDEVDGVDAGDTGDG